VLHICPCSQFSMRRPIKSELIATPTKRRLVHPASTRFSVRGYEQPSEIFVQESKSIGHPYGQ
jgi:hypothetical protein